MKTKKHTKVDQEMMNLFKEIYQDEDSYDSAVKDAKKAFSYVKQDVLYRSMDFNNQE